MGDAYNSVFPHWHLGRRMDAPVAVKPLWVIWTGRSKPNHNATLQSVNLLHNAFGQGHFTQVLGGLIIKGYRVETSTKPYKPQKLCLFLWMYCKLGRKLKPHVLMYCVQHPLCKIQGSQYITIRYEHKWLVIDITSALSCILFSLSHN